MIVETTYDGSHYTLIYTRVERETLVEVDRSRGLRLYRWYYRNRDVRKRFCLGSNCYLRRGVVNRSAVRKLGVVAVDLLDRRGDPRSLWNTTLPSEARASDQEFVDFFGDLSTFLDTPDNEGLTTTTITSSKDTRNVGGVALLDQ